jgi:hypothetical protein
VVHLDEQGEATAFQAFDDGAFPGRAAQVQRRALQAAHQFAEFALAAGPGQRRMAHVVFEVDVVVLDPDRHRVLVEGCTSGAGSRARRIPVARNSAIRRRM